MEQLHCDKLERNFKWFLLGIVLLALVVRLCVCIELADIPAITKPEVKSDMENYLTLMRQIWNGNWPDHFEYQPFYYTVFLPLCRLLGGDNPWPIMLLQSLIGTGTVWLAGLCGARLFGRTAGLLGALFLALCKGHVFFTPFALFEVLQTFWMILLLWLGLLCWKRDKWWLWCLTALVLSAATLTRGNALLLLPVFLGLLAWREGKRWRTLEMAVVFVLLFELPQLPFAIRNYHYMGRWVGPSTAGDRVLILGNSPEAPAGQLAYPKTYFSWVNDAELRPEQGRVSATKRIFQWALQEPLIFLDLQFRKCLLFWNVMDISHNVSVDYDGAKSVLISKPLLFGYSILIPLALFGLFRERRWRRPEHALLLGMVMVCWLGTAIFYILSRFRLATLPMICLYAGFAVMELIRLPRRLQAMQGAMRWGYLGMTCACALLAIFLSGPAYSLWCHTVLTSILRKERPNGQFLVLEKEGVAKLQDTGPLLEPARFSLFVCVGDEPTIFLKRLELPPAMKGKPCFLRLPIRFTRELPKDTPVLMTAGKAYVLDARYLVQELDQSLTLEIKLDALPEDGVFAFRFPKNFVLPIDETSCYDRTSIFVNGKPFPKKGELAVELYWLLNEKEAKQ
ncbi:MAG: glycosyltransferase family 39 protein [Victivallales bacterium]|nr:glycosyltransferase family 39 protein [Victivallales bacterium]